MSISTIFGWILGLFRPKPRRPRELVFIRYPEADVLLRQNQGWRLAPEEDGNRQVGWVCLERDLPASEDAHG